MTDRKRPYEVNWRVIGATFALMLGFTMAMWAGSGVEVAIGDDASSLIATFWLGSTLISAAFAVFAAERARTEITQRLEAEIAVLSAAIQSLGGRSPQ